MFFTGAFDFELSNTLQSPHDKELWDDDVLSALADDDKALFKDGYVSNKGNVVTIHIANGNLDRISDVMRWFSLNGGGVEIVIEPFAGWQ